MLFIQGAISFALAALLAPTHVEASHGRTHFRRDIHHAEARGAGAASAHNPYHAHRDIVKRAVTADPTGIEGKTFDFIIVGGGVAGLVIASRLSEMKNQSVLVIEAGGDGSEVAMNQNIPGYTYHHGVASNTPYGWNMTTVTQTSSGATKAFPLGRGLGGSGAINGMFWCRGDKAEYDAWGELNPGTNVTWNWEEINKYIKKAETLNKPPQETIDKFHMPIDDAAHGHDGPLQVGWSQYIYPVIENWIPTFVNLGLPSHDLADGKTRGVMITPSTIDPSKQERCDARRAYLDHNTRENLFVLTHHQGTKIFFNGTKDDAGNLVASGVEFQADANSPSYKVYTAKEIIVSSGAVNSPKLLQLSGIGPASYLNTLGIKSVLDLPVGHNFQDHASHAMFWDTVEGIETWFALGASEELKAQALAEYEASRTGLWTYVNEAVAYASQADLSGSQDAASKMADSFDVAAVVSQLAAKYSMPASVQAGITAQYNIQKKWMKSDVGTLEYIMHLWGKSATSLGIQVCLQHAFSRGTVMIASADPFAMPLVDPNYFGVDIDATIMQQASEWIRKYVQTAPMNTIMKAETIPGADVTGDALWTYVRNAASTEYHPMSSCSMLPKDKGGVVDTSLKVYGASNLRVADASIMPIHVSAHLMASTYGVAEKVADLIKEAHTPKAVNITTTTAVFSTSSKATATASVSSSPSSSSSSTIAEKSQADSSPLSLGAKIGIGVGAGIAAIVIVGALLFFCMNKTKKETQPAGKNGWYAQGAANGQWQGAADNGAYQMNNNYRNRPLSQTDSVNTMATNDLPSRPSRSDDARFGLNNNPRY